jgi:hypothetical protein
MNKLIMAFNPRSTDRQRYRNEALTADGLTAQELVAGSGINITNVDGLVEFSTSAASDYQQRTSVLNQVIQLTSTDKTWQDVIGNTYPYYFQLPDTSTLEVGRYFIIQNRQTGTTSNITIRTFNNTATVGSILQYGQAIRYTCVDTSSNIASAWVASVEIVTINGAVQIGTTSLGAQNQGNVVIGYNSAASSNLGYAVSIGQNANASGDGAVVIGANASSNNSQGNCVIIGRDASASAGITDNATAVGYAAIVDVDGGLCLGSRAQSAAISGAVVLSGRDATTQPAAAANAVSFGTNTSTIAPGYFGISVNNAAYALEAYSSLFTTTATAAGTTTLTATSSRYQVFTGTTTQTVVLPVVTTLRNGFQFEIISKSTGVVTIQTSGAVTLVALAVSPDGVRGKVARCMVVDTTAGTGTASWTYELSA